MAFFRMSWLRSHLHGADVVLRHGGKLNGVAQAEGGITSSNRRTVSLDHVLHLLLGHEDMGIILVEAADTEQSVERAGELMTVDQADLAHPQGRSR